MNAPYHIRRLGRQEIDSGKWDACIEDAPNGLIYGRAFYLDHMTGGRWDGLVLDEYRAVMPLTWKSKWGIRYLAQPAFTQQLGIFSATEIPGDLIAAFLSASGEYYRFAEIFLNYGNAHPAYPGLLPATNLILSLDAPYTRLAANYKKDLLKNLKEAARTPMEYISGPGLSETLAGYRQLYGPRMPHVKEQAYARFQSLCEDLQERGELLLRGVVDTKGQLLATALLPRDKKRIYLLQSTLLPAGRDKEANHFLLDRLIEEWAGQPLLLDFEGSDLPGVAHFYRNFGSVEEPYYFYRHNRLPWPLKLFK